MNDLEDIEKIFVQNIVINMFRFERIIVLVVASLNIAVILLNKNQIVHARFKIFLNIIKNNICNIEKNIYLINLIIRTQLIF